MIEYMIVMHIIVWIVLHQLKFHLNKRLRNERLNFFFYYALYLTIGKNILLKTSWGFNFTTGVTTFDNFFLIRVHLIKARSAPPSRNNNNPNEILIITETASAPFIFWGNWLRYEVTFIS